MGRGRRRSRWRRDHPDARLLHLKWHLMKLVFREHLDFHISEERGNLIASHEMTFNEIGFPRTPGLSYFRGKKKLNFSQEIWVLSGNFGKRNFEYSPILAYFELKWTRWSSRGKGRPPIWCSDPLKICCRNISPYRFYRSEPLDIFLT